MSREKEDLKLNVIYYKDPNGNFGDDLNDWIWNEVAPFISHLKSDYSMLGFGSIINIDIIKNKKVVVFGSGIAYGIPPNAKDLKINCVRGKLSAKILGIDESYAVADSAILIREIPRYYPIEQSNKSGVIFIPHHETFNKYDLSNISNKAGVELINPCGDSKRIIEKIQHAKLVVTEAMHGAIISDAMRTPWIPVVLSSEISTFKWLDWLSTFNLNYNPIYIGLPNVYLNRMNKLKINNNRANFKPNYHLLNENEILARKHCTIKFKIGKMKLKFIKPLIKNKNRENEMAEILKSLIKSKGYLSDDLIFDNNLKLLKSKLEELKYL